MKTLYERISPYLTKTGHETVMRAWDEAMKILRDAEGHTKKLASKLGDEIEIPRTLL